MPRNLLLASLPADERSRMAPHLRSVHLNVTEMIHPPGKQVDQVYFLEGALNSLVAIDPKGNAAESALAGVEGVTGIPDVLGTERTIYPGIVQASGEALAMDADRFHEEWDRDQRFRRVVMLYDQYLQGQMAQTTLCNAAHSSVERLARWLLMAHDAIQSDVIDLTPDYIATMLAEGPKRSQNAVDALVENEIIEYDDGRVTIQDRKQLETVACDCFDAMAARRRELLEGYGGQ